MSSHNEFSKKNTRTGEPRPRTRKKSDMHGSALHRWCRGTFLVLSTAIGLLAFPSVASAASEGTTAARTRGGNLTVLVPADVTSFNIAAVSGNTASVNIAYNVYGGLAYGDTSSGATTPLMLKSISGSPDGRVWTLKLRPNIRFTDGTPLNSAAIKANFDYLANPANRSRALQFAQEVASWDTSDPLVAVATLAAPDAAFGAQLQYKGNLMASPTALQQYGADYGTTPDRIVGAGPFVVQSWVRGSQIVFARNTQYWDKPRPYLDTVTVKIIADPSTALNTVTTGGAQVMTASTAAIEQQGRTSGLQIQPSRYDLVSYRSEYQFNLQRAPFNDALARQAVTTALDPTKIAAAMSAKPVDNIFDPGNPYYDKVAGTLPKFDRAKAQQLINEWSSKNGGKALEFTIYGGSPGALGQDAEAIQAALSGYQNLTVRVQTLPFATALQFAQAGNFDLFPGALGGSDPDIPYSSFLRTGSPNNVGKYSQPAMDAALNAGKSTTVIADRKKAYAKVQEMVVKELPLWVMPYQAFSGSNLLITKSVRGRQAGFATGLQTEFVSLAKS